jgi:hypothetical protein
VLDHIRCELIAKGVSGETPGGIFTLPELFFLEGKKNELPEERSDPKVTRVRVNVEGREGNVKTCVDETSTTVCVFQSFHK